MTVIQFHFDLDERPFPPEARSRHAFNILATVPRRQRPEWADLWTLPALHVQAELTLNFAAKPVPAGFLNAPRAVRLAEVPGWHGQPVTALTLAPIDAARVRALAQERFYDPLYDEFILTVNWEHL